MANQTVLFLPGLLEDADAFAAQVERLRPHATCIVADLTEADSIAALAARALKVAPEGPLCLVGHSMGGYVALEAMRQAPRRIERLALLNTHARPDSEEATQNRRRLMALAAKDFPAVIETLMPKLMTPRHLEDTDLRGTITEMALAVGKDAFLRQEAAIIGRIDSRPSLDAIRCPTLVVAARHDQLMPVEILQELALGIPGARLEMIEDSGHMATIEQPRQVAELLDGWLGR
ncbi:MAG TPA: alpha/beta fold hydrolase [Usitatibacter sp.]|jgi:pimeloyl-ACP methyl ester carboxylesterase|nr:alpha/beta fold hydrolase [Usitatibacter sp.]